MTRGSRQQAWGRGLLFWAILAVWGGDPRPGAAGEQQVNGIAVVVNKKIITWEEIRTAARDLLGDSNLLRQYQRERRSTGEILDAVQRDSLELLLERELVLDEFEKLEFQFPENVVEQRLRETTRRRFGDRVLMMKTLQEQGRTLESLRQQIREDLIFQAMLHKNVASGILISPYKVETYYRENPNEFRVAEQMRLRMIFLAPTPERSAEATRRMADEIRRKLQEGVSFAEMAAVYSDGTQRAEGGDLGWRERSTLDSDLVDAVAGLTPGQFSDVLEKNDGCYLLMLEGQKPAQIRPLAEVRDQIEQTLRAREERRLRKQWIDRLKNKSFIESFTLRPSTG